MDFTRKIRIPKERKHITLDLKECYPHNLMLYRIPPTEDICLNTLIDVATERLKVFKIMDKMQLKPGITHNCQEYHKFISELKQQNLLTYVRLVDGNTYSENIYFDRQNDYISHFILRFVYCKSYDLQE